MSLDSRISVVVPSNTSGLEQQITMDRVRGLVQQVFTEAEAPQAITSSCSLVPRDFILAWTQIPPPSG